MVKIKRIKDLLSLRKKMFLKYALSKSTDKYLHINKDKKKIIVTLAADYGNLGDVAITYAQTKFLKANFPEYEIIDFPISKTFVDMKSLKKICTPEDIITIVGGGNTGDMYDDIEYCRQFIIDQFPNNKIVSFPQTIDFSETSRGKKALQKTIRVYSKHKNLTLSAREKVSYEKYQRYFPQSNLLYLPDIVLFLDEHLPKYQREGITLCLRSDKEKRIDGLQEKLLVEKLNENYDIRFCDTHISKNNMSIEEREIELNNIWATFKKSKVVITDRLHGMIFCAITKTPCVAIDNSNRKISGVYDAWLKDFKYIRLVKEYDLDELLRYTSLLWDIEDENYLGVDLEKKFNEIIKR